MHEQVVFGKLFQKQVPCRGRGVIFGALMGLFSGTDRCLMKYRRLSELAGVSPKPDTERNCSLISFKRRSDCEKVNFYSCRFGGDTFHRRLPQSRPRGLRPTCTDSGRSTYPRRRAQNYSQGSSRKCQARPAGSIAALGNHDAAGARDTQ